MQQYADIYLLQNHRLYSK